MNTAQDIKLLKMYLQFGGTCIQKIFPEIKNLDKYKIEFTKKKYFEE